MGELADALQANLSAFERDGGKFNFTSPLEMVRDLVVLRRAISPVQILAADNPPILGYEGYWNYDPGGGVIVPPIVPPPRDLRDLPSSLEDVSVRLQMPVSTLRLWVEGARPDQRVAVARFFMSADGRRRLPRFINEITTFPVQLDEEEQALFRAARLPPLAQGPEPEPEPEPEVYILTRWERMLRDDEPL